jgi:hypothetical protein
MNGNLLKLKNGMKKRNLTIFDNASPLVVFQDDNASPDSVSRVNAFQDNVSQDNVSQDNVSQDSVSQDSVFRDSVSQDNVSQDSVILVDKKRKRPVPHELVSFL